MGKKQKFSRKRLMIAALCIVISYISLKLLLILDKSEKFRNNIVVSSVLFATLLTASILAITNFLQSSKSLKKLFLRLTRIPAANISKITHYHQQILKQEEERIDKKRQIDFVFIIVIIIGLGGVFFVGGMNFINKYSGQIATALAIVFLVYLFAKLPTVPKK